MSFETDSQNKPVIAITMGTSLQGMAVTKHLARTSLYKVRVITRNPLSQQAIELSMLKSVEIVKGDLLDRKSLRKAFDGVYGIYGNTTPTTGWKIARGSMNRNYEMEQGRNLVEEAELSIREGNLQHLIFSSVCKPKDHLKNSPAPGHFTSKWDIEDHINKRKMLKSVTTFLRPVSYFENFLSTLPLIKVSRRIFAGLVGENVKWQTIAVDDIGQWSREIFKNPEKFKGKSLNIAGEELTGREMAMLLEKIFSLNTGESNYIKIPNRLINLIESDLAIMSTWIERTGYGADMSQLSRLSEELGIEKTTLYSWLYKEINKNKNFDYNSNMRTVWASQWITSAGFSQ